METDRELCSHGIESELPGDFYNELSFEARKELASLQFVSSYRADAVVFCETDKARGMFVVMEGEVRLSIGSSDGRRLSLRIARKGDILGLESTISGERYDVTAETVYPARLAHIGRSEFMAFLGRRPEMYKAVIGELSRNALIACEQLRIIGLAASAPEKLARFILERSESRSATCRFRFAFTHQEIGEFIGISRETVTRTLSTLKNRRLVAFKGSMLTIPSRAALENFAHASQTPSAPQRKAELKYAVA